MAQGITSKEALDFLSAEKDKVAKVAADSKLATDLGKLSVSKALAKLATDNPNTVIVVKLVDGKATFGISGGKKGTTKGSKMSARSAWDYAVKKKCSIVLAADFERDVVEVAKATQGIGQRGILFRDFNASEAVAKLRDYGYDS